MTATLNLIIMLDIVSSENLDFLKIK